MVCMFVDLMEWLLGGLVFSSLVVWLIVVFGGLVVWLSPCGLMT